MEFLLFLFVLKDLDHRCLNSSPTPPIVDQSHHQSADCRSVVHRCSSIVTADVCTTDIWWTLPRVRSLLDLHGHRRSLSNCCSPVLSLDLSFGVGLELLEAFLFYLAKLWPIGGLSIWALEVFEAAISRFWTGAPTFIWSSRMVLTKQAPWGVAQDFLQF